MIRRTRTTLVVAAVLVSALALGSAAAGAARPKPKVADFAAQRIPKVAAPASITSGTSTATWRFRLANVGTAATKASTAAVYLSRDAKRGPGDVVLGRTPVKSIAVAGNRIAVVTLAVPAATAAGSYRLIGCVLPAKAQVQRTTTNDCIAAATTTAIAAPAQPQPPAPTAPAAATLTSISENGRGTTLHPIAHGTGAPAAATIAAYGTSTCTGSALGSTTAGADGAFDVSFTNDIAWGASITLAVTVTTADGTSACSNALTYTHRGVTYTYTGTAWTGPSTIPSDSLVRIVNAPDAIPHFTSVPVGETLWHAPTGTPGAVYDLPSIAVGSYAWYNHTGSHTDQTGAFTVTP